MTTSWLLEESQQREEKEPEDAHGVPKPGCAVDENLTVFKLARDVERGEGGKEGGDAKEEMNCVDAGDEIEEVAALVGLEEDVLGGEFAPGDPLAAEKDEAEGNRG